MEAFSDGVLAIGITLLVLDLRAPGQRGAMLHALLIQWPLYVAYFASFACIGVIWVNHHQLFTRIASVDTGLLWRNLLLLLLTASVLPFPAAVLGSAFQHEDQRDETVGLILYAIVAAAMAASWLLVFQYLSSSGRLLARHATTAFFARERRRAVVGIVSNRAGRAGGTVAAFDGVGRCCNVAGIRRLDQQGRCPGPAGLHRTRRALSLRW